MDWFRRTPDPEPQAPPLSDEQALARYRYLLATAPPEDIERAHEEAFARLTPDQRRQALQALAAYVPQTEVRGDDPSSLARTATRAELRAPGTLERAWGGPGGGAFGGGIGMGSWFLSTLAASFVGTAIAQALLGDALVPDAAAAEPSADPTGEGGDGGEARGGAWGEEPGWDDPGDGGDVGGDFGGDFGDLGGF